MKSRDGLYQLYMCHFNLKKERHSKYKNKYEKKTLTNTKNRLNDFIYHANDLLNSNSFLVLNS